MLMDPMGGIVMTNDGNAILREVDCNHPAAKSMIELSRSQEEEVGDGTTSVIIMAGETMNQATPFIQREIHPTVIVGAYYKALEDCLEIIDQAGVKIDINDDFECKKALVSCVGTKFAARWGSMVVDLALKACRCIMRNVKNVNKLNLEIKRYAKVEKIPGGMMDECMVLEGVMMNKDVTHGGMRRHIKNPRVLLLDCTLEYKKAESQTAMHMSNDTDMGDALQQEIDEIAFVCKDIMKWNPDVVVTEKGVSDLAQHFLMKQNISVIRRARKTDNNRIARVTGATIVTRPEEICEDDIGKDCGLFEIKKLQDDYFTYFLECKNPSACSILLRGGSKDSLNELERNLQDAMGVCRNIFAHPVLVPGGGAIEMHIAQKLNEKSKKVKGLGQKPYKSIANALESIPRTLAQNCGCDVVRLLTELRAKHNTKDGQFFGIDGETGKMVDMREKLIWDPIVVKSQVMKTAIESSCMLLRIDDIVSGIQKQQTGPGMQAQPDPEEQEGFGDQRDG
jgi:T-complex protein 1 subunit gamma